MEYIGFIWSHQSVNQLYWGLFNEFYSTEKWNKMIERLLLLQVRRGNYHKWKIVHFAPCPFPGRIFLGNPILVLMHTISTKELFFSFVEWDLSILKIYFLKEKKHIPVFSVQNYRNDANVRISYLFLMGKFCCIHVNENNNISIFNVQSTWNSIFYVWKALKAYWKL